MTTTTTTDDTPTGDAPTSGTPAVGTPTRSRRRPLGHLGASLEPIFFRLQNGYIAGDPRARAELAQLRRGLGKPPGMLPELGELTFGAVPRVPNWVGNTPSREERSFDGTYEPPTVAEEAAHVALTLFALHQQSKSYRMHTRGMSLGRGVRLLSKKDGVSEAAVRQRFLAVLTAETLDEVLFHIRGLVAQLRTKDMGLDYSSFADDLVDLQIPERADRVQSGWGQQFSRTRGAPEQNDDE